MFSVTAPKFTDVLKYGLLYPFIIRGLYLLRQSFEPIYMNSNCLLDLVRISSPEHWDLHPLWKQYTGNSNATCESITNVPIDDFFLYTFKTGTYEFTIFYSIVFLHTVYCSFCFLKRLFTGKITSVVGVIAGAILAFCHASLLLLFSHYQNDLTHLNGNVMHHSSFTVEGTSNATFVNTLPPGLIINYLLNYLTVYLMMYVSLDYFKIDKWAYFSLSSSMIIAKIFLQMKVIHPYIHQHAKSWYGPFIAKYFVDDYTGHVLCHHVNGYCLGDTPFYSKIYDGMLYAHAKIYELGYFEFKTPAYYALNIAVDYVLLISIFALLFLTVAVLSPFLQKTAPAAKAEKTKSH